MEKLWKNIVGGGTSGLYLTLVGHPFDVIKVRLQTSTSFTGVVDCIGKTFKNEGISGFYKGATPPLLSTFFMNSIVFSTYNFMKNQHEKNYFISGSFSGFVSSLFVTPFERLKILTQIQYTKSYKGPLHFGKQILQETGLRGIYKGVTANIVRDTIGRGVYFSTYEYLKSQNFGVLLSGGLSGMATWMVIIPVDTIKSRIQSDNKDIGIIEMMKKEKSIRMLYRGTVPVLLRSFPANAAAFYGYEMMMKILN